MAARTARAARGVRAGLTIAALIYGFGFLSTIPPASAGGPASASKPRCDYYASPTGTSSNDGSTSLKPVRPQDFWALARPGTTLCLMDGTYRGAAFMLAPFAQRAQMRVGTATNPITIRALNDGKVLIDGQAELQPVVFSAASWVVLEGFNACCSSGAVVKITGGSADVTVRRIVAWDAKDTPHTTDFMVFEVAASTRILLEDVAGFGLARKIFQAINSNGVTFRRAWGRWEGYASTFSKPRTTFAIAYKTSNAKCENCVATWSGELTPTVLTGQQGVFNMDVCGNEDGTGGSCQHLGSIGYLKCNASMYDTRPIIKEWRARGGNAMLWQDVISVVEPGCWTTKTLFDLADPIYQISTPPVVRRLSGWGGQGTASFGRHYSQTNVCTSPSFPGSCPNPYTGANGANVCKRYVDGVLTNEVLWPWPMDQRIKAALASVGRRQLAGSAGTVTSEIESLLGSIPLACRSDGPGR